jgi:hypothetical protein
MMSQKSSTIKDFFEAKPELLKEIESFERRRSINLLRKLTKDEDEINFFSWLSEARFGLFFDKFCTDVKSDCRIDGKTPDWFLKMNEQTIISEVLRLNIPEDEHRELIEHDRQMIQFQKENPGALFYIKKQATILSLEYLSGNQSKLVKKEEKYRDIIQKHKMPFILCVAPSRDTFISELDFSDFLMGERGFFKRDEKFKRDVTGVLLNTPFSQFFYYHNEDAEFQLTAENLNVLRPFSYIS